MPQPLAPKFRVVQKWQSDLQENFYHLTPDEGRWHYSGKCKVIESNRDIIDESCYLVVLFLFCY